MRVTAMANVSHNRTPLKSYQDHWDRSVAAEKDVKALLWIARVNFK
jgi:hypothetical protein